MTHADLLPRAWALHALGASVAVLLLAFTLEGAATALRTGAPAPVQGSDSGTRGPISLNAMGHVIFTRHTGCVVVAEDADSDGRAEFIGVADNVTPFEGVPSYDGPGSVARNEVGLVVVTAAPPRNLVFRLIDGTKERTTASPGATIDLSRQGCAVVVLDDSMGPMPLSTVESALDVGPVAACQPRCTWWLDHGATSCNAICMDGCAACGQWQGAPRCACAPFRSTPALVP